LATETSLQSKKTLHPFEITFQLYSMRWSLTCIYEEEFNSIQLLHTTIRSGIEQGLRQLRMGGIPWSPKLQGYRDMIKL
jgi:hypothetical protein